MKLLERIAEAREQADAGLLVEAVPYARFLGLKAETVDGRLITRLPYAHRNLGNPDLPAQHGGVIGAFLELTGAFELMWSLESAVLPRTINITIDYLRPARPVVTSAHGIVTKSGRQVANVRIEAWQENPDRPIAHGHAHFLIAPSDEISSA